MTEIPSLEEVSGWWEGEKEEEMLRSYDICVSCVSVRCAPLSPRIRPTGNVRLGMSTGLTGLVPIQPSDRLRSVRVVFWPITATAHESFLSEGPRATQHHIKPCSPVHRVARPFPFTRLTTVGPETDLHTLRFTVQKYSPRPTHATTDII